LRSLKAKRVAKTIYQVELFKCLKEPRDLEAFLSDFRSREEPRFFFDKQDIEFFKKADFPEKDSIIADADAICQHNFDLLGSGKRNVDARPGKIDWHRDFKSGKKWPPDVFFRDIPLVKGDGAEIHVSWELSRFQHAPTLGKAYTLTGEEKYAREFVEQISDWIDSNPPGYGVNWRCPMDVAIRAVNWIWGYHFFKESKHCSDQFLLKFLKSLLIHGRHVRANLEHNSWVVELLSCLLLRRKPLISSLRRRRDLNNHYIADLAGLVYLGVMLPELKEAKKWLEFGTKELAREMANQVYPDGVAYEGSTSYHRLQAELFLSTTLLCLRNGLIFPQWYLGRLKEMIEFTLAYTKPDGTAPQIGDNDDGRLHVLSSYGSWDKKDHRHLLDVGAVLFNRPDFKLNGRFPEEALWLQGEEGLTKWHSLKPAKETLTSRGFNSSGYYIMRQDSFYMIVDCISNDRRAPSGHRHNSRLSFELYAYDKNFIVDPGAYIYTAEEGLRNLFCSTEYHNTVVVDSQEQNRFYQGELFYLEYDATPKINQWQVTEEYDFLDAEHDGYRRLKHPVIHRRQIWFDKVNGFWIIKDVLNSKGPHRFDLYFHFAPMKLEIDQHDFLAVKTRVKGANIAILPLEREGLSAEIIDGWVSHSYGVKQKAPVVRYSKYASAAIFCNIIYPAFEEVSIAKILKELPKSKVLGEVK